MWQCCWAYCLVLMGLISHLRYCCRIDCCWWYCASFVRLYLYHCCRLVCCLSVCGVQRALFHAEYCCRIDCCWCFDCMYFRYMFIDSCCISVCCWWYYCFIMSRIYHIHLLHVFTLLILMCRWYVCDQKSWHICCWRWSFIRWVVLYCTIPHCLSCRR